jgi:hypothetical protein
MLLKIVAWGDKFNDEVRRDFKISAQKLRDNYCGVDPGLADGQLILSLSVEMLRRLINKRENLPRVIKSDQLEKIFDSIDFISCCKGWEYDYSFCFDSAEKFLKICHEHNLCISLCQNVPEEIDQPNKIAYVTMVNSLNVNFIFAGQPILISSREMNMIHVSRIPDRIYNTLASGDKIIIKPDPDNSENWQIKKILRQK